MSTLISKENMNTQMTLASKVKHTLGAFYLWYLNEVGFF